MFLGLCPFEEMLKRRITVLSEFVWRVYLRSLSTERILLFRAPEAAVGRPVLLQGLLVGGGARFLQPVGEAFWGAPGRGHLLVTLPHKRPWPRFWRHWSVGAEAPGGKGMRRDPGHLPECRPAPRGHCRQPSGEPPGELQVTLEHREARDSRKGRDEGGREGSQAVWPEAD